MTALLDRYTRWFRHRLYRGVFDDLPVDHADWFFAVSISVALLWTLLAFPVTLVVMAVL